MKGQASVIVRPIHKEDDVTNLLEYITRHLFANHDKLDKEEMVEVNYRNYI